MNTSKTKIHAPLLAARDRSLRKSSIRVSIAGGILISFGIALGHHTVLMFGLGCALLVICYGVSRRRLEGRLAAVEQSVEALAAVEKQYRRHLAGQYWFAALFCAGAAAAELTWKGAETPITRVVGVGSIALAVAFVVQGIRVGSSDN